MGAIRCRKDARPVGTARHLPTHRRLYALYQLSVDVSSNVRCLITSRRLRPIANLRYPTVRLNVDAGWSRVQDESASRYMSTQRRNSRDSPYDTTNGRPLICRVMDREVAEMKRGMLSHLDAASVDCINRLVMGHQSSTDALILLTRSSHPRLPKSRTCTAAKVSVCASTPANGARHRPSCVCTCGLTPLRIAEIAQRTSRPSTSPG